MPTRAPANATPPDHEVGTGAVAADRLEEFFDAACEVFSSSTTAARRCFRIGGRAVAAESASPELAALLLPSFEHLAAADGPPDLRIAFWEGHVPHALPPPPWSADEYFGNGEIRGSAGATVRAAFDVQAGVLSLYHTRRHLALCWVRDGGRLPAHIVAAPFRTILQWHAEAHGQQLAHAAAVGGGSGGVLIAGGGGAGKSSAAVASFLAGLEYAGDDYVLVEPAPVPRVHALFGTAKLEHAAVAERFPELAPLAAQARRDGEKALLDLVRLAPARMSAGFPLRAVLLPRITHREASALVPATGPEALLALLPHTLFPLPGARREAFERLAALVRGLPCFVLESGRSRAALVEVIRRAIAMEAR